jgi:diaminopimelate epimerase
MEFTKLHGLGNDYLYIDATEQDLSAFSLPELSRVLSERHFGVGADGIILVEAAAQADFRMRIFNADGSEAEMCGNGVRGFGKYVYDHGLTQGRELQIETGAGIIGLELAVEHGKVAAVRADLGVPRLTRAEIPMRGESAHEKVLDEPLAVGKYLFPITCVSMGNPHCVIFLPEVANFPVAEVGPLVEHCDLFPHRTNTEFARVLDPGHVQMRVWERGSGETLACGTGASATVVAGVLTGRLHRQAQVQLLGGNLEIDWAENDHVFVTGPAAEVFTGVATAELIEKARL